MKETGSGGPASPSGFPLFAYTLYHDFRLLRECIEGTFLEGHLSEAIVEDAIRMMPDMRSR